MSAAGHTPGVRRLASLQAGRGLAALYVLLFHAEVIQTLSLPPADAAAGIFAGGHAGVQFFFVLSGFIMGHIHRADLGRRQALGPYLRARFVRIYPPFWVILVGLIGMQMVLGRLEPVLQSNPLAWVQAFLLLPFDGAPPLTAAWTLSHEILFYLIFGLCIYLGRAGLLIFALWMLFCLMALFAGDQAFPVTFLLSPNNLLFGIGLIAAALFGKGTAGIDRLILTAGAGLFVATTVLGASVGDPWQVVFYGISSGLLIHGAANLELRDRIRVPRLLEGLGDASYSIYLAHGPAMAFAAIILARVDAARGLAPLTITALLVATGLAVGLAFHLIVERPLLGLLRPRARTSVPPATAPRADLP